MEQIIAEENPKKKKLTINDVMEFSESRGFKKSKVHDDASLIDLHEINDFTKKDFAKFPDLRLQNSDTVTMVLKPQHEKEPSQKVIEFGAEQIADQKLGDEETPKFSNNNSPVGKKSGFCSDNNFTQKELEIKTINSDSSWAEIKEESKEITSAQIVDNPKPVCVQHEEEDQNGSDAHPTQQI